jgi:RES domain-containing protein
VVAWRLARSVDRSTAFSGIGSFTYGARWNSRGQYAVYVSLSLSTAALEIMVHCASPAAIPNDEQAIRVVVPDKIRVLRIELDDLPDDWQELDNPACVAIGDAWIQTAQTAVLDVPSAVVPQERNLVLNPKHPDFALIDTTDPGQPFRWDPRLISYLIV